MSLNISVNMTAYNTANNLRSHYSKLTKSIERLSSGKRLNNAGDSPTQMAEHNINLGKIAVYNKGIENLREAVSLTQTAESAIESISERLIRMKEIAEQVSTGTYTNEQRMILQSEFSMMGIEIDRLASFTDFKGVKILNGNLSARNDIDRMGSWYQADQKKLSASDLNPANTGLKISFGDANKRLEDYYFIKLGDLRMKGLMAGYKSPINFTSEIAVSSQHAAQEALTALNTAMANANKNRIYAGVFQNRLTASLNHLEDHTYQIEQLDSVITDVDFAEEMTNYTSYQMLTEAATSMLTQANTLPQIALKLLGN